MRGKCFKCHRYFIISPLFTGFSVFNSFHPHFPGFQDVHVMIFIGFGFLMTFLQRYGFSSVGFNFLIAALALQWATLMQGFFHGVHGGKIHVGVERYVDNHAYMNVHPNTYRICKIHRIRIEFFLDA